MSFFKFIFKFIFLNLFSYHNHDHFCISFENIYDTIFIKLLKTTLLYNIINPLNCYLSSFHFQIYPQPNESLNLQKNRSVHNVQQLTNSTDHIGVVTSADFNFKTDSPILKIIHNLFERLGWPNNGILDGRIPKANPNSIDTQNVVKEDDGEFVYCLLRNPDFLSPLYDPYDLILTTAHDILKVDEYFTISATYVSRVSIFWYYFSFLCVCGFL